MKIRNSCAKTEFGCLSIIFGPWTCILSIVCWTGSTGTGSKWWLGQFNRLFYVPNMGHFLFCLQFYCTTEIKTELLVQVQWLDMMICRFVLGKNAKVRAFVMWCRWGVRKEMAMANKQDGHSCSLAKSTVQRKACGLGVCLGVALLVALRVLCCVWLQVLVAHTPSWLCQPCSTWFTIAVQFGCTRAVHLVISMG